MKQVIYTIVIGLLFGLALVRGILWYSKLPSTIAYNEQQCAVYGLSLEECGKFEIKLGNVLISNK